MRNGSLWGTINVVFEKEVSHSAEAFSYASESTQILCNRFFFFLSSFSCNFNDQTIADLSWYSYVRIHQLRFDNYKCPVPFKLAEFTFPSVSVIYNAHQFIRIILTSINYLFNRCVRIMCHETNNWEHDKTREYTGKGTWDAEHKGIPEAYIKKELLNTKLMRQNFLCFSLETWTMLKHFEQIHHKCRDQKGKLLLFFLFWCACTYSK